MDTRTKTILEYYLAGSSQKLWFTWYDNDNDGVTTEYYIGTKEKVKVPKKIEGKKVTELECTTFWLKDDIEQVKIANTVTTIQ